jgi:hypothetical protein
MPGISEACPFTPLEDSLERELIVSTLKYYPRERQVHLCDLAQAIARGPTLPFLSQCNARLTELCLLGRNTTVERSQHLTQADPRVFGQSYVANCSSVDGQAAFRDEESDQRHIKYFQGLEKFHEDALPDRLPAHLEEDLGRDPQLCELESDMRLLMGAVGNHSDFSAAKRRVTTYRKKLTRDALRLY